MTESAEKDSSSTASWFPTKLVLPRWTHDQIQSATAVAGVIVSLLGFLFIGYQIGQAKAELHANTHERLLDHNLEVLTLIASHPDTRPYFYDDVRLSDSPSFPDDIRTRNQVLTICEIFTDLFEHVALQRDNMPADVVATWTEYAQSMYEDSYELRHFLKENQNWYHESLHEIAGLNDKWPEQFK